MLEKFRAKVKDFVAKGSAPSEIAFAVALGNFVGILPFLGLHTVMALALAYILRLNMVIVFLGTQISNPFSFPFIVFVSAQIGSLVLNGSFLEITFTADLELLKQYLIQTLLGSVLLGLAVSAAGYFITIRVARRLRP